MEFSSAERPEPEAEGVLVDPAELPSDPDVSLTEVDVQLPGPIEATSHIGIHREPIRPIRKGWARILGIVKGTS